MLSFPTYCVVLLPIYIYVILSTSKLWSAPPPRNVVDGILFGGVVDRDVESPHERFITYSVHDKCVLDDDNILMIVAVTTRWMDGGMERE